MKKILKIVGIIVGAIVLLVAGFIGFLKVAGMPSFSNVKRPDVHVEVTPVRVERGRKIMGMLCYNCHYNAATNKLSGHFLNESPPVFGKIYSHNITSDKTNGIGGWTDGEILYFLRTGIHKNNEYVPPYMPKFPHMAEEDIQSLVAYLRSNDSLVAPSTAPDTAEEPSLLALFLGRFVFKPYSYPTENIPLPPAGNSVAVGKYWAASVLDCYQCHSADFKTNDGLNPEKSVGFFGGGNELTDPIGKPVFSRNITPDMEHGIGKWTPGMFLRALRDGLRPDNTALRYPMARFPELSDSEIVAIYDYLRTVPSLSTPNKQSADYKYANANPSDGEKVYYKYACYACHGQNGIGMCDLTHACDKYHSDEELTNWIKNPSKIIPGTKMPTWEGTIREEEFAPLVQYVRQLGHETQAKLKENSQKTTASLK
ncbi:MAG TPA: c-type cytochrome [Candidatus Kapabacteria bacterium]|nr:c-type cytochrome [Candidatus Kapabacteria bacterium]